MKICSKTVEKRFKSSTGCSFIKSSVIVVGGRGTEAGKGKDLSLKLVEEEEKNYVLFLTVALETLLKTH